MRSDEERVHSMNVNERIWNEMKTQASEWAASARPLPAHEECLKCLDEIAASLVPEPYKLPALVREFYAQEFCEMIAKRRSR